MFRKCMVVFIIACLVLSTSALTYGAEQINYDMNKVVIVNETAEDMQVIDQSIPEVDTALESIPTGERKDLIWEYWFTPTSEVLLFQIMIWH